MLENFKKKHLLFGRGIGQVGQKCLAKDHGKKETTYMIYDS